MILFLLIIIIAFLAQLIFPWWIIIPITLLCCYIRAKTARSAFILSFLSIFTLWIIMSVFLSFQNEHLLANRVGEMLGLSPSSYNWIVVGLIATLPGALTAAFSGVSGFFLRKIIGNN